MAWIEIHQTLPRHRKIISMSAALDVQRMSCVGHMISLWCWALDNAPDGDLSDTGDVVIATAAEWPGDADQFLAALIKVGFLDQDGNTLTIHNWYQYAGRLIERRLKDAERKRKERLSEGHPTDVQRMSSGCPVPPYPTVPYPKKKKNPPLTDAPDWLIELREIDVWPKDGDVETKLLEFVRSHSQDGTAALRAATALVGKWPGDAKKPYKNPVSTFKNWLVNETKRSRPNQDIRAGGWKQ